MHGQNHIKNLTGVFRRRLCIALCGGIVLEEALDLSSDRILNEWISWRPNVHWW